MAFQNGRKTEKHFPLSPNNLTKEPHLQAERALFTTPFGPDCIHNKMAKPALGNWGAKKGEHVCTPLAMQRYY
ncbi:hypothetical protein HMPREF6485_2068 [Segatella buccae ATCC 33574]|uniref:Uncharacterized protein n=1 Tax=Segatella buccae ATCC 33574 TaxID=873513 RepID=E6K904_9BACT|nr:hypothetical protein HMPREF6485_2068 [Segatella buccae ATCC 33574]